MANTIFAERLISAMDTKGLKQVDIIRAAEVHGIKLGKSHISQYVSGKTVPRENILNFLAKILEVDINWLAGASSGVKSVKDNSDKEEVVTTNNSIRSTEDSRNNSDNNEESGHDHIISGGNNMREFKKSQKLDNVLYDVRGPVVDEAARMEAAGTQVLKLNIGNPAPFGFCAPDEVIYDMRTQLTDCEGYSASKGLFSARKAIMQYMQNKNVKNVEIEDIYTGNGYAELHVELTKIGL